MNDFQVLIKRVDPELPLPRYSKGGDAGADIGVRIKCVTRLGASAGHAREVTLRCSKSN